MTKMYYNGVNYTRTVSNDIAPTVDSITWYNGEKEVLDSDLANELELYYETLITNGLVPQTHI